MNKLPFKQTPELRESYNLVKDNFERIRGFLKSFEQFDEEFFKLFEKSNKNQEEYLDLIDKAVHYWWNLLFIEEDNYLPIKNEYLSTSWEEHKQKVKQVVMGLFEEIFGLVQDGKLKLTEREKKELDNLLLQFKSE